MRLDVKVTGTAQLAAKLKRLEGAIQAQHLANATMAGALVIEGGAKRRAPVRTGTLRRSIHSALTESTPTKATATVGTNVEYAAFQEFGTRYMSAHPYLRPALDSEGRAAQQAIAGAFRVLIMGAVK